MKLLSLVGIVIGFMVFASIVVAIDNGGAWVRPPASNITQIIVNMTLNSSGEFNDLTVHNSSHLPNGTTIGTDTYFNYFNTISLGAYGILTEIIGLSDSPVLPLLSVNAMTTFMDSIMVIGHDANPLLAFVHMTGGIVDGLSSLGWDSADSVFNIQGNTRISGDLTVTGTFEQSSVTLDGVLTMSHDAGYGDTNLWTNLLLANGGAMYFDNNRANSIQGISADEVTMNISGTPNTRWYNGGMNTSGLIQADSLSASDNITAQYYYGNVSLATGFPQQYNNPFNQPLNKTDNATFNQANMNKIGTGISKPIAQLQTYSSFDTRIETGGISSPYLTSGYIGNMLLRSNTWSTAWVPFNSTLNTTTIKDPISTATAYLINNWNSSFAGAYQNMTNNTITSNITCGVWAQSVYGNDTITLMIGSNSTTQDWMTTSRQEDYNLTQDWQRVSVTQNISSPHTVIFFVIRTNYGNISIYGASCNGGDVLWNYYPTTTAAVAPQPYTRVNTAVTLGGAFTSGGACSCTAVAAGGAITTATTGAYTGLQTITPIAHPGNISVGAIGLVQSQLANITSMTSNSPTINFISYGWNGVSNKHNWSIGVIPVNGSASSPSTSYFIFSYGNQTTPSSNITNISNSGNFYTAGNIVIRNLTGSNSTGLCVDARGMIYRC